MIKFATAKEHRNYFRKHRHVEFEGLLTEQQCLLLNAEIDAVLCQRIGLRNPDSLPAQPVDKMFAQGRDLWRADQKLKKIILNRAFAQAAADLIEHKPLRIGYDQLIPGAAPVPPKHFSAQQLATLGFADLLKKNATLPEISCIQGVACGLILCIRSAQEGNQEGNIDESSIVFPKMAGHGVFIASDVAIDFSLLNKLHEARYLLIVYSQFSSVYCHEEGDSHIHSFRNLGYNFGDRLTEQLNPLVYS